MTHTLHVLWPVVDKLTVFCCY